MRMRPMFIICLAAILSIFFAAAETRCRAADWEPSYLAPLASSPWLENQQRLCFGIGGADLQTAIGQGVDVICGGTNAAGIGFAGGPFILGKNGRL